MYLYKTQLTEAQIEAYEQPEGTRNPECGGGINCAFCALKMLDVYNKEFAEQGSNMCVPRSRTGNVIKDDEHVAAIKSIIKDVYGEDHVFNIRYFPGNPREVLTKIASELGSSEACYLVYGSSDPSKGRHAVVLRRGDDGVIEMIDPQRGRKDEGTPYGITGKYAKELDDLGGRVDVTDNYYRVRGGGAIELAMKAQSVAFEYWKTMEEFDEEFAKNPAVFTIGTLLIDSMIKTTKMELDEPAPPPNMKMEVDGGARSIYRPRPRAVRPPRMMPAARWKFMNAQGKPNSKIFEILPGETLEAEIIREGLIETPPPAPTADWITEFIRDISHTTGDDEEFAPKYVDVLEITENPDGTITRTVERTDLDIEGNEGESRIISQEIRPNDNRNEEEEEEKTEGGAKRKREETTTFQSDAKRRKPTTALDFKRTSDEKAEAEKIINNTMKPGKEGLKAIDDTIGEIARTFYPGEKARNFFEDTTDTDAQCTGVFGNEDPESEICWLCGFAQIAFDPAGGKPYAEGGDPLDRGTISNEAELEQSVCEHKLPVKVAYFFRLMYSTFDMKYGQITEEQYTRIQKLYGTAHIICNIIKDDHLYLKSTLGDKTFGEFTENKEVIVEDMKKLLAMVRKRDSTHTTTNDILTGDRMYEWGTLMMRQTGKGKVYYRNALLYRIHKMEGFKTAGKSYGIATPKTKPLKAGPLESGLTLVRFTGKFTYPSVAAVKKWTDIQYTNIVGGINELRVLLNSEKDLLYPEGVKMINRKPYFTGREWWKLVIPYVTEHPEEAEEFKHGLHVPFKKPKYVINYKPIQRVWREGDIEPQSSKSDVMDDRATAATTLSANVSELGTPPDSQGSEVIEIEGGRRAHIDISVHRGGRRVIEVDYV
jgi:hypothetical protein